MDISFFLTTPAMLRKRAQHPHKAKPHRAGLNKHDQAAIRAYQRASAAERKVLLHNQVSAEEQSKLDARRAWRRNYMRQYRAMRLMGTILL
jgi:hypothetical protein